MNELLQCTDGEIKAMVMDAPNVVLVAALRDASPEVLAKVFKHFSRRAVDLFTEDSKSFKVQCYSDLDIKDAQKAILSLLPKRVSA